MDCGCSERQEKIKQAVALALAAVKRWVKKEDRAEKKENGDVSPPRR